MIYRWKCPVCETHVEVERPIAEHAIPPDRCEVCPPWDNAWHSPQWVRIYEAPMQLRASFPDGYKRPGWTDLKESARLEKLAAVSGKETKREIKKEIRKMGVKPGRD